MNKDELLKLLRGVIGEERPVYLCEIFHDKLGENIQLRFGMKPPGFRSKVMDEMLEVYKHLQAAGLAGYLLRIYAVDAAGNNCFLLGQKIESKRPIAVAGSEAGNRWRVNIVHFFDAIPPSEKIFVDMQITGGKIELSQEEAVFWDGFMATVRELS
jgi:hypothetical protein